LQSPEEPRIKYCASAHGLQASRIPDRRRLADSPKNSPVPGLPLVHRAGTFNFTHFWSGSRHTDFQSTCGGRGVNYVLLGEDQRIEETSYMSMQSQLADLEAQHRSLEAELSELMSHPGSDDLKIIELKRRKLHLKDEISRLRHSESTSVH
jgi:hypothetical protein